MFIYLWAFPRNWGLGKILLRAINILLYYCPGFSILEIGKYTNFMLRSAKITSLSRSLVASNPPFSTVDLYIMHVATLEFQKVSLLILLSARIVSPG